MDGILREVRLDLRKEIVAMSSHPVRYRYPALALALTAVLCLGCTSTQTPPISSASQSGSRLQEAAASAPAHHFEHVLIVVLENQSFAQAINDPYLHSLAQQGASFEDFHGLFHPSYANYLT